MNKKLKLMILFFLLLLLPYVNVSAQRMQSDNGDGTYTNPVIYSDYPDPDVIRVDSVYYMVSPTMFFLPWLPNSKDFDWVSRGRIVEFESI